EAGRRRRRCAGSTECAGQSVIAQQAGAVADQLLLLEGELRRLQMWTEVAPNPDALASSAPFCVDTLALEAWLQWVFVPRLRTLIEAGAPLPAKCAISPVAEVAYQAREAELATLFKILRQIDRLLDTP